MSTGTLRFGIIGTGAIAGHHIASIRELPDCEVVALASSTEERAKEAFRKFGIKTYANFQHLLEQEQLDVVCVLTKSGAHLEPTLLAASKGIHIITEKPLEVSLDRADQMIQACAQSNVHLACIFQNRFTPAYRQLRQIVDSGKLGRLLLGNAYIKWYRAPEYYTNSDWKGTLAGDGGAAFINQGIHTIDLLLDIMGDVREVVGKVRTMVHPIEGEDLGVAMLEFKSGALGAIQAGTSLYPGYPERLEVFGEKGSIILEGGKIKEWNVPGFEPVRLEPVNPSGASDPMAIDYKMHLAQFSAIVNDLRNGTQPPVTGTEARKSLALIQAIYTSSHQGTSISL